MQYNFYYNNRRAVIGVLSALKKFICADKPPVIVCIGSDRVSGDSLGPVTGSMLKNKLNNPQVIVLGSLDGTVTAKEIKYLNSFLRETFLGRTVICIDSAVGSLSDVGVIKISDSPLLPGSGINKRLGKIGDVSVQGVVAEKNFLSKSALSEVKMGMIYKMSDIISDSITKIFSPERHTV